MKCFVLNNFFTCPKELTFFQNGVFAISTVSTRWLWSWHAENRSASKSQKVCVGFNLHLTIEVLIILLCRKNVSVEGVPASGSHLRLGVYVLPGNTKEKAQIFSGFHQPDIINPNWCFALSNVFRTDLFNTFHNQRIELNHVVRYS